MLSLVPWRGYYLFLKSGSSVGYPTHTDCTILMSFFLLSPVAGWCHCLHGGEHSKMADTYICIPSSVMKNNNGSAIRTFEPLTVLGKATLSLSWYTV